MKYRAITISREYGSGGAEIARIVAASLDWKLVDHALLEEIARRAGVPESDAKALDEHVDPWLHRILKPVWGKAADGVSLIAPVELFDADTAATLASRAIGEAYAAGDCVIVGRGAQCVLRGLPDVFHVFVYASVADRAARVAARVPASTDLSAHMHAVEDERFEYVRRHYGENRLDPHLYDLMVNSHGDAQTAAQLVLMAARYDREKMRAAGAA